MHLLSTLFNALWMFVGITQERYSDTKEAGTFATFQKFHATRTRNINI